MADTSTRKRTPKPPTPAQKAARKAKERDARRAARPWLLKLTLWFTFRVAPISLTTSLIIRPDFRLWFWSMFCTIVPVDMIPFLAQTVPGQ